MADYSPLFEINSATQGELRIGPLSRSTAEVFAASLRRTLMREVKGAAICAIRIDGAGHEFALLDGVVEDVVQIVENLKRVRIGIKSAGRSLVSVDISGPQKITAEDLTRDPNVMVANPSQVIASVNEGGRFSMTVEVANGAGYESVQQIRGRRPGWIEIDRRYSPVKSVAMRVEEKKEVAFLSLAITTDGRMGAEQAIVRAASILELNGETSEPIPALCRAVVEAALRPVQAPAAAAVRPEPRTREICKTPPAVAIPDLTELPRTSYEAFVQQKCKPAERKARGLEGLLRQAFPIQLASGERLDYEGYALSAADACPRDCLRFGKTCSGQLEIHLRSAQNGQLQKVNAGLFPQMTERGTFIIAGGEKVVVGQLQASAEEGPNDLASRRLRLVGDQLEAALAGPLAADVEAAKRIDAAADFALPEFAGAVRRFFAGSGLVRPAERTNPLALVSQLRAVVQHGIRHPGYRARDVHSSHFGRLCLLETPEGEKIGINLSAALLARIDDEGRLLTPYRKKDGGDIEYLSSEAESAKVIADLEAGDGYTARYGGKVLARSEGEITRIDADRADYVPAHPSQALGASASLIPFIANDDANRALMGTNMQKQAVPLLSAEAPLIRTGIETRVAGDADASLRAKAAGLVTRVAADEIVVLENESGQEHTYFLTGFSGSSLGTCLRQHSLVSKGDEVAAGQIIGAGPAIADGALALGRNILVGYLSWEGSNFEDSLVISERLIKEDIFTSIKVREFVATIARANVESEKFGADHLHETEAAQLSPEGIVREGAMVEGGDLLVARTMRRKGLKTEAERRDVSLRLPAGQSGTVVKVEHYAASKGDPLDARISELVRVTVAVRRRLKIGDKLANRHGAKGIVGRIVPEDEMPTLPDGRPLDLILNPLGVPSRMNIGQLLETHLGLAAHQLNCTVVTPGFNGATVEDVDAMLEEAGLPHSGMFRLRDGRTGRLFDQESTVGYHYFMKLVHMVDDKHQARCTGSYSDDTETPLTGRGNSGGQRLGIMETWALQAHGAGHILQEMLTLKSDDGKARGRTYKALLDNAELPRPTVPHSVRRLVAQLRGLCLDLKLFRADSQRVDVFTADAAIDDIVSVSLEFASADTVRQWSAERLACERSETSFEEFFGVDDEPCVKHIELAAPVKHPWRSLVGEAADELPDITALPILPRSLRAGRQIDPLYLAVCAENEAIKSDGDTAERVEALQRAVDQLMGDRGLTHLLYGKRGWFAAAMSGKSVDYSARTVVAPGYGLRYDECGLPKKLAKSLFEPFVVGELMRTGHATAADAARQMLRDDEPTAVDLLGQIAEERVVLLHRAPVLHRWGIQAFRPLLTDEDVVRLHPLALVTFNADFDGDEMDIYLPLSVRAQEEAAGSMRPSVNQVGLASGEYANGPTQDMVFGCYYATVKGDDGHAASKFATLDVVAAAFEQGDVSVHDPVEVGSDGEQRRTTVGKALFNQLLPRPFGWIDGPVGKRVLAELMQRCWRELGAPVAARLGDAIMRFGFHHATLSGLSIGKDVLTQHSRFDSRLAEAWRTADELDARATDDGQADPVIEHWVRVTNEFAGEALEGLAKDRGGLNPVHLMVTSGARGNQMQVKQHIAMRGLFATPDGRIMEAPCTTNFIRGHSPLEYLASTCGARKGLSDTALKTANAGFLFKRIVNAVQDVLIAEEDCGTDDGITKRAMRSEKDERMPLAERISNRTALEDLILPGAKTPVVKRGELIDEETAAEIAASNIEAVSVRSPLTCKAEVGICGKCYGADLSRWELAAQGLPVGVIAAHSIGEPMTQLTMRTFALGVPARHGSGRKGGEPPTIVAGLPRLDELFEAGKCPGREASAEREVLEEMLRHKGALATAEYLLTEMAETYRMQGVRIDDRHFEVILRQMLNKVHIATAGDTGLEVGAIISAAQLEAANSARSGKPASGEPVILGVTEAASLEQDFIAAATSFGGIPALARAAAQKQKMDLDGVRSCTLFGKVIPARNPVYGL